MQIEDRNPIIRINEILIPISRVYESVSYIFYYIQDIGYSKLADITRY